MLPRSVISNGSDHKNHYTAFNVVWQPRMRQRPSGDPTCIESGRCNSRVRIRGG